MRGIWVVDILDSRGGDEGRLWLRGRAGTGAADGTSAVVATRSGAASRVVFTEKGTDGRSSRFVPTKWWRDKSGSLLWKCNRTAAEQAPAEKRASS